MDGFIPEFYIYLVKKFASSMKDFFVEECNPIKDYL